MTPGQEARKEQLELERKLERALRPKFNFSGANANAKLRLAVFQLLQGSSLNYKKTFEIKIETDFESE